MKIPGHYFRPPAQFSRLRNGLSNSSLSWGSVSRAWHAAGTCHELCGVVWTHVPIPRAHRCHEHQQAHGAQLRGGTLCSAHPCYASARVFTHCDPHSQVLFASHTCPGAESFRTDVGGKLALNCVLAVTGSSRTVTAHHQRQEKGQALGFAFRARMVDTVHPAQVLRAPDVQLWGPPATPQVQMCPRAQGH